MGVYDPDGMCEKTLEKRSRKPKLPPLHYAAIVEMHELLTQTPHLQIFCYCQPHPTTGMLYKFHDDCFHEIKKLWAEKHNVDISEVYQ